MDETKPPPRRRAKPKVQEWTRVVDGFPDRVISYRTTTEDLGTKIRCDAMHQTHTDKHYGWPGDRCTKPVGHEGSHTNRGLSAMLIEWDDEDMVEEGSDGP